MGMADQQYETTEQTFRFNGKSFQIKRIKNLDDLVDQIDDEQFKIDERLPYWAELWPSAIGFARYVFKNSTLVKNKSVLELGCGLGLTSLALFTQEPASLLLTDYEQDALHFTAENFKLNNLPLPNLMEADWRTAELNRTFDVICASDVLYEKRFFTPLLRMFSKHLANDGTILLAEPGRPIATSFFDLLTKDGFKFKSTVEKVNQDGHNIFVRMYQIYKRI